MGGDVPKQFRPLRGKPVLLWSLQTFLDVHDVAQVVVVLPAEHAADPPSWLASAIGTRVRLVAGGVERHDSVERGTAALAPECITVLVHDAARPLVDHATIERVIATARSGVGAVPALPVGDTVKEAGDGNVVTRTVPRDRLWRAQTPQGFPRELLLRAQRLARDARLSPTDDAAEVEHAGGTVLLVAGAAHNFKLTTEADFELAELLVSKAR